MEGPQGLGERGEFGVAVLEEGGCGEVCKEGCRDWRQQIV